MTTYNIAYRMRVYAPRSVDPTETTILTPAAGAAHSDEFKVATIAGVSGYQPYLHDEPRGRRGRMDLLTRKLDVGTRTVTLIDKTITAGDNLTRWWSAFFGDVKGRPMGRLKVQVDECLDYMATSPTWSPYATMELVGTKLVSKNQIQLSLRDRVETLKMKCFVGQPHSSITYAAIPTLCPIGFRNSDYGKISKTLPLTGLTANLIVINGTSYTPSGEVAVYLNPNSTLHELNILTQNLVEITPAMGITRTNTISTGVPVFGVIPQYTGTLRAHVKQTSGGASGTEGDYKVGAIGTQVHSRDGRTHERVWVIALKALESTDVGYAAIPSTAVNVEVSLYNDGPAAPERPMLLNDVDPAQYIQDLCAGYFSQMYRPPESLPSGKSYGDPKRAVTTNGVSSLEGTRPTMRLAVTKVTTVIEEIERVCKENRWAPYMDAEGRLNVVDLDLPASLAGVATLTDTDVIADDDTAWEHDPTAAFERVDLKMYAERIVPPSELWQLEERIPRLMGFGIVEERTQILENLYIGSVDFGEERLSVDARGFRAMDGEEYQGQPRSVYYQKKLEELGSSFAHPFGYGLTTIPLRCRRTATVTALTQGALAILDVDVIPDPATHKRGGSLLCRILEYSEEGPEISLRLAFLAGNTVASTPTLGAPAQQSGNTWSAATTAVTLNAQSHPVQVRYAITETSVGSVPANDSPLWTIVGELCRSASTFVIRDLWPGKRVWVQGRSFPVENTPAYVPSSWTNAGGTGRVDMAGLPSPSALAASSITDKTALLAWTNGSADVEVEILLMTPTTDARRRIARLPAGTTRYSLVNLTASTTYRAEVRHAMGQFYGTGDTEDLTTLGSGATTPAAPLRLQVIS